MSETTQEHSKYAAFMALLGARDAAKASHQLALMEMREAEVRGDAEHELDSLVSIVMSRYSVYVELDEMVAGSMGLARKRL